MVKIQKNILLAPYTTFKIGGPAKYFSEAKNVEEIIELCQWARLQRFRVANAGTAKKSPPAGGLPVLVLGGGSNVLISDRGFDGLVIKIRNSKFEIRNFFIKCEAGIPLSKIVVEAANAGLTGLEWAVGIPGTIGGAIVGNSGAYGHSISEAVVKVKTVSVGDFSSKEYSREECNFVYRGSRFSAKGGSASGGKNLNEVIISAELRLSRGDKDEIRKVIKDIASQRKTKIPPFPSAGSFLKNYKLKDDLEKDNLIRKFPDLAEKIRSGKLPVGYLIEQCGLREMKIGGAMIANEHANFIVNAGGAAAKDVLALADLCRRKVKEKFGIDLEIEKKLVGFD